MARIAVVLALVVLAGALPAQAAAPATGAAPAAKKKPKCKKGYVRKTVTKNGHKVSRCVKKKAPNKLPGNDNGASTNPDDGTGGGATDTGQPTPTPGQDQPPPAAVTRDDPAGQQAISGGDLMLERYEEGGSVSFTIYRIWLWQTGDYKFVQVDYNQVSGEICSKVQTGTWAFKEGYTFTDHGGGTAVKVTITLADGTGGDDLVTFVNSDAKGVSIGAKGVRVERNPNMLNGC
jgi:hypothetical protein